MKYYGRSYESFEKLLKTDFKEGLSEKEAKKRLARFGTNIIFDTGKRSPSKVLYGLFYDPVSILLLVSALILFSYKSSIGASLVLFVWFIHNFLTILMYYKSEQIFYTVKTHGIPKAKVLREGKVYMLDSRLLVPGDVLIIEAGDIVCADCNLVSSEGLYVYEKDVTGREELVRKFVSDDEDAVKLSDMHGVLFASCSVISGHGIAVVTATSHNTEIVSTAGLLHISGNHFPEVFKDIKKRCRILGIITTILALVIFIIKIMTSPVNIFDSFLIVVAIMGSSMSETLLPLTQVVCAKHIYKAANRVDDHRVIIKNAGAIDNLRDVSVFVLTDEIVEHEGMDLLTDIQSCCVKCVICVPKNSAFKIATKFGCAVYDNVDAVLNSKSHLAVYISDKSYQRIELITELKNKGESVGALTTRLDCIRMLTESDVAFTYAKVAYKTNSKLHITPEELNSNQNQILSRVADVLCERGIPSLSIAAGCASSIFTTISDAASYLITAQVCRCIFAIITVMSGVAFIRYNDILLCGMLMDLFVVMVLSHVDCASVSKKMRSFNYSRSLLSSLFLIISIMSGIYLPKLLSVSVSAVLGFADVTFVSLLLFSVYTIICSSHKQSNKKILFSVLI